VYGVTSDSFVSFTGGARPGPAPVAAGLLAAGALALVMVLLLGLLSIPASASSPPAVEGDRFPGADQGGAAAVRPSDVVTHSVYLPLAARALACQPIPGESYDVLSVVGEPTDRPAEEHADLNLTLRGYELTAAYKGLVNRGDPVNDPDAPQLAGLFADQRTPTFSDVYQVHHWDWGSNSRGPAITDPEVTLAGLATTAGETIHVPASGYDIGGGYQVLVLYATDERITLKYTRDDNVVVGYTLHVEGVCVEPRLLALYQQWNAAGRGSLPALRGGQAFGRARGAEIGVAIRDTGSFMDPRSAKDWWQGR